MHSYPDYNNLSSEAKAALDFEIQGLQFGDNDTRIHNCLKNDNAVYVRQVVIKTRAETLQMDQFGRKSRDALEKNFGDLGLRLGMKLPPEVVSEGSAAYEAKKVSASPAPETAESNFTLPDELSPHLVADVLFKQMQMAKELEHSNLAEKLRVQIFRLLPQVLDSILDEMDCGTALHWHQELLNLARTDYLHHETLGPLLYKLWGVVERTRATARSAC